MINQSYCIYLSIYLRGTIIINFLHRRSRKQRDFQIYFSGSQPWLKINRSMVILDNDNLVPPNSYTAEWAWIITIMFIPKMKHKIKFWVKLWNYATGTINKLTQDYGGLFNPGYIFSSGASFCLVWFGFLACQPCRVFNAKFPFLHIF